VNPIRGQGRNFWLPAALLAYAGATFLHHAHNAEHLHEYPNMPAWLAPSSVYLAWIVASSVGLIGYAFLRRGWRTLGGVALGLYAAYGLDSLVHYALAPFSAHSAAMHLTIVLEASTALALLAALAVSLARR
jgi:hypothetical protein